jgi:hypothetical protein
VEGDLNLQEISKPIVVKDEKNEKIGYMRCNIFHDILIFLFSKLHEKKGRDKPKVNLILSNVNHAFFILDTRIGHQAFKHIDCVP